MEKDLRKTGIDVLGDVPWGTHLCQFYRTNQDLIDILVPYFKKGLEENEFCIWITSDPLNEEEAKRALEKEVPHLDRLIKEEQIQIIPYDEWYLRDDAVDTDRVLKGWVDKLDAALSKGFDGMRVTVNTFWLEKKDWRNFTQYEERVNNVMAKYKMIIICSYSLEKCGSLELIDVTANHKFALVRREGKWGIVESSERTKSEKALRESEFKYRSLFDNMPNGFAYCKILLDENNIATDFVYLEVNDSFERLTGLKRENVVGKKASEAMPGIKESHPELFDIYGKVALTGKETAFDIYFKPLQIWLSISAYRPEKDCFVAILNDITEGKKSEEAIRESEERYRTLSQGAAEGILVVDIETKKFKYANPALCKMLGYTEKELKGMSVADIHPKENLAHVISEFEAQARGEKSLSPSIPCLRKDGTIIYADINTNKILIDERECNVGFFTDTTEQRRAEEEIEFLSRFPSENPNPVLRVQADGEVLYANDPAKKIFQVKVGGRMPKRYLPILKKAEESEEEVRLEEKFGQQYYETAVKFVKSLGYFNMYSRDSTYQVEARSALKESEVRYRRLFELSPIGIITLDFKGVITSCNSAVYEKSGYTEDEFVGKHFSKVASVSPGKIPDYIKTFGSILRGKTPKSFETRYRQKDGTVGWTELHIAIMRTEGKKMGILVLQNDGAGTHVITFVTPKLASGGLTIEDPTVSLLTGEKRVYGNFDPVVFNQPSGADIGKIYMDSDGTESEMKAKVYRP